MLFEVYKFEWTLSIHTFRDAIATNQENLS